MAVMYTVLSTAETGLLKTPYTKMTPSSEVVPAREKAGDKVFAYEQIQVQIKVLFVHLIDLQLAFRLNPTLVF